MFHVSGCWVWERWVFSHLLLPGWPLPPHFQVSPLGKGGGRIGPVRTQTLDQEESCPAIQAGALLFLFLALPPSCGLTETKQTQQGLFPQARSGKHVLSSWSPVNEGKRGDSEPIVTPPSLFGSLAPIPQFWKMLWRLQPGHILVGGHVDLPKQPPFCIPQGLCYLASLLLRSVLLKSLSHSPVSLQKTQNKPEYFLCDTQRG